VNGAAQLHSLYHCFITIMVNVSPYSKSLSMTTAVKLVSLFELFTAPSFLYKDEGNYVYVALLLEVR
jgi:High-temperature-induced dauer-formation protein